MSQERFSSLPEYMQNDTVAEYMTMLEKKKTTLFFKRMLDIIVSLILIILLSPFLIISALAIKLTSKGPIIYRQTRVGRDGRDFKIFKFRTMVVNADKIGTKVTVGDDPRITKAGRFLRKTRIDEFPQFFNVLIGDMSLIGPRPEVRQYVDAYKDEYYATLLVRPGLSCRSSIGFADEAELLANQSDPDRYYIDELLPPKSEMNLKYLRDLSILEDIKIFFATIANVFK
jgi:lipopolysaccharide/colanic/teichoic acid biosynthesis glycosyltransferase